MHMLDDSDVGSAELLLSLGKILKHSIVGYPRPHEYRTCAAFLFC